MNLPTDNRGGVSAIVAILAEDFRGMAYTRLRGVEYAIPGCLEDCHKYALPIFDNGAYNFRESEELSAHGERYSTTIAGKMPRNTNTEQLAHLLASGDWIVCHRDNNGRSFISGNEFIALKFELVKDSGSRTADANSISFTFSCVSHDYSKRLPDGWIDKFIR